MNDTPVGLYYSSVVYSDTFSIALLVVALNDLDTLPCDISNTYLNAPCQERIWFLAGVECVKSLEGKVMKLVHALNGLKISGASSRKMFKEHIVKYSGFAPSIIHPDMYYLCNTKKDGTDYYKI